MYKYITNKIDNTNTSFKKNHMDVDCSNEKEYWNINNGNLY